MKWILRCTCLLTLLALGHCAGDSSMLMRTLDAYTRTINYMLENVSQINLDAVFCARKVQEQMQAYLEFQPEVFRNIRHWLEVLRDKAKRIADEGLKFVYINSPEYAKLDGTMVNESKKLAWYPSDVTSLEHTDVPVTCPHYYYNWPKMNQCYNQLSGGSGNVCDIAPECYDLNSEWNQRDYGITHQVLFWEQMEGVRQKTGCVDTIPADRRMRLCSNVMRDAKRIADAGFPHTHTDLFMEQIGLCGLWGFKDFNKPDWLEKLLELQEPSGCYSVKKYYYCFDALPDVPLNRVKRAEHTLEDGCMSHKTAVAMMALLVNIRFEAEKNYLRTNSSTNQLNALLDGTQVSS